MKKGFTLVELVISIALLSVVMIFLINYLKLIKIEGEDISNNTEKLLDVNIVSKIINEDITNNNGINTITCNATTCTITLNTNANRSLIVDTNLITYKDLTNNKILLNRKMKSNYTLSYKEKTTIHEINIQGNTINNIITITSKK